ncbi:hypothetical protein PROFUN_08098 [Planoprotostelium fungivorum]|uniref:DNA-(apurinic or apyrimidinic site) endonuclease n=1 Tax=Planoprotostelium fungivorum TaxID=1890364 RepID=A0A2P6NKE2_9EUKA|nr:hypothetical protein PROFUN_08098 [Planoprotostelium fungivorum]
MPKRKEDDISKLTVAALKELLTEKGLSTKGKKDELVARLKNGKEEEVDSEENESKEEEDDEEEEEEEPKAKKAKVEKPNKETTYPPTDFTKPAKRSTDIKIVSWNVAGWASVMKKGFSDYLDNEDPDIICVQETKIKPSAVKEFANYPHSHFIDGETPGYAGVGIISKHKPIRWIDGINHKTHDKEGRCITAEFEKFYLVNTYIPNSGRKLVRLSAREDWDVEFMRFISDLEKEKPVVWTGDLNVAHLEIDLKNPKPNKNKTAGFTDAERAGMTKMLDSGFVDAFRHFYPEQKEAYTFWSFMGGARKKNVGWRLDYFIVSKKLVSHLGDCYMRTHIHGSDHCPLVLHFDFEKESSAQTKTTTIVTQN